MANQIGPNPWMLDTASATPVFTGYMDVVQFEFSGYALDTDSFEIKDANGKSVWKGNGEADLSPVRSGKIGWIKGLALTTLSSGVMYVYIK